MFKKILSAVLAMTMVLSMAVTSSAALGKTTSKTTSEKTTSTTTTTTTSKTTTSSKGYDFCKTQLAGNKLALAMHDAFVSGLRANKNKITVSIKGYTEAQVYSAFQTSVQMIFDEHCGSIIFAGKAHNSCGTIIKTRIRAVQMLCGAF